MKNKEDLIIKIIFLFIITIIILTISIIEFIFFKTTYFKGTPESYKFNESLNEYHWFENNKNVISIKSEDNLTLYANEFVKNNSNNWVVICHGIGAIGKHMAKYGLEFYNNDYNVLILELRGNGISEGDYFTYGHDDKKDVLKWIDYIIEKNKDSKIVLLGTSMGASTCLLVAGENPPKNVTHIISDSGYSSLQEEFEFYLKEIYSINPFPILNIFNIITKLNFGYFCDEVSPKNAIKNSTVPILFIHGKIDNIVPFYMLDINYENANCPKEKIEVENTHHIQAINVLGTEKYFENIFKFIKNN